ncbi:MAG: ABC transporter permease subunit, partial [Chloroflexota bacterium]|nr:ABC transporter permease subunit [Chloroflexota bacterium]
MDVWKNTGFAMLIFLAGLQNIPDMYYEAAQLDGANRWQPFRHVTLPLISPTIFFNMIIFMIGALQVFDSIIQWLIFRRIALPLAGPSLAALAILTFNTTWNNYFYPLVFLNTVEKSLSRLVVHCANQREESSMPPLHYTDIAERPTDVLDMTSLTVEEFVLIVPLLEAA